MITVYSDDHLQHSGLLEPDGDSLIASFECPQRAQNVLESIRAAGLGELKAAAPQPQHRLTAVHDPDYVEFLANAWQDWIGAGEQASNARPYAFVGAGMRYANCEDIYGKLGRYSFDATAPIVAGSWQAIRTSANIALTAADLIRGGDRHAFALCRPPGHHATRNQCGGYCYLNNCAIAAQSLLNSGKQRIAILDLDYHHGNGTQSIFYDRNDVLTISVHADPALEYPFFLGYADEPGEAAGHGFNVNYPMPFGTGWNDYREALEDAGAQIQRFGPDALIVALGLDTYADDPTTRFLIRSDDYTAMGAFVGGLGLPVLTVLEGGYAVDAIGLNATNFLAGAAGQ